MNYIIERGDRIIFSDTYKLKSQKNWTFGILNNLKNGLFIYNYSKKRLKFINKYLIKYKEFITKTFKIGHGNYLKKEVINNHINNIDCRSQNEILINNQNNNDNQIKNKSR